MSEQKGFRPADDSGVPVPSRLLIIEYLSEINRPTRFDALCQYFRLKTKVSQEAVAGRIQRLVNQGILLVDRKQRLALVDRMGVFTGRVIGHANGFGFVRPDQGGEDLYLHHRQMRKVLHGDHVLAKLKSVDARGRKEGVIVEVLVDPDREIVGHYHFESGVGFVEPDDSRFARDIAIPVEYIGPAQPGDIVVVKIIRHPVQHHHAVGRIHHIMGSELAPGMETDIAIRKHEIPYEWPQDVEKQLEKQYKKFTTAEPGEGRKDIRDLPLVTIDGADARDFDDAVYCRPNSRGWRLVVAIADVSHYVKVGSALDTEALNRGNSVYFPNRVVPMLPALLSNGICSLNPEEDRCCMVCDMQVGKSGKVRQYRFYPGLMHSKARLTYDLVAEIIEQQNPTARQKWQHVTEQLDDLHNLYQAFAHQRGRRGTINFEFPEPLITFDVKQRISSIGIRDRNVAHKLIEECMLAANICAAEVIQQEFSEQGIYRNHAGPDSDDLEDLRAFLKGIGLHLGGDDEPGASDYSALLTAASKRPEITGVVQTVLLRSLSQAVYSTEQLGHFALACPVYTHFTSPIRRYPDLVVHRLIRNIVNGKNHKVSPHETSVAEVGEQCSFTERRAEDASRDVIAWLKAEFMQEKIGQQFDGVVSGVKEFGVFVQLDHIFVDGLVHVTSLGSDYYHFDPLNFQLVGERSGRRFRLGDRISIIVSSVDLDQARIDFELATDTLARYADPAGNISVANRRKKHAGSNKNKTVLGRPSKSSNSAAKASVKSRYTKSATSKKRDKKAKQNKQRKRQ